MATEDKPPDQIHVVKGNLFDKDEAARIEKLAIAVSERAAPPWAAQYIVQAAPVIGVCGAVAEVLGPIIYRFYAGLFAVYKRLPHNAANCLWGLGVCFYGGRYPLALAAVEAWKMSGGNDIDAALVTIRTNANQVLKANEEEEARRSAAGEAKEDEDGKSLLARKTSLVLRAVEPEEVSEAVAKLWTGSMGVLAALKLKFARTTALAHAIGDGVRPLARKLLGPTMVYLTPKEHRKWVSPTLNALCKILGLTIAWKLTRGLSIVQSGMNGGLLASRSGLALLSERGLVNFVADETMVDEILGYALAGCGVYYQMFMSGDPVQTLFLPVTMPLGLAEGWLQWSIAFIGEEMTD